ncbi:MAG: hypothetical protein GY772_28805 [bacterium]|nr:hypothetical protein [bacterium]
MALDNDDPGGRAVSLQRHRSIRGVRRCQRRLLAALRPWTTTRAAGQSVCGAIAASGVRAAASGGCWRRCGTRAHRSIATSLDSHPSGRAVNLRRHRSRACAAASGGGCHPGGRAVSLWHHCGAAALNSHPGGWAIRQHPVGAAPLPAATVGGAAALDGHPGDRPVNSRGHRRRRCCWRRLLAALRRGQAVSSWRHSASGGSGAAGGSCCQRGLGAG